MESTSPLKSSTKEARIIDLCATTRARPAGATVCGSFAGGRVSCSMLGTQMQPWLCSSSWPLRTASLGDWVSGLQASQGHGAPAKLAVESSPVTRELRAVLGLGRGQESPAWPVCLPGRGRALVKETRVQWAGPTCLQPALQRPVVVASLGAITLNPGPEAPFTRGWRFCFFGRGPCHLQRAVPRGENSWGKGLWPLRIVVERSYIGVKS